MICYIIPNERCSNCNKNKILHDPINATLICENCGTVIKSKEIDYGREWRVFFDGNLDKKVRTGTPGTQAIHDKGIGTVIKTVKQNKFTVSQLERIKNLSKYHKRIRINSSIERNLYNAFEVLEKFSSTMNLPKDIKETVAIFYRKIIKNSYIKGKSIKGILAILIFFSCKLANYPVSLEKIISTLNISKREISRCYSYVLQSLPPDMIKKLKSNNAIIYIPQIINSLNLNPEVEIIAKKILEEALKKGITAGKTPKGLAAATVYLACIISSDKRTQKQIADIASVTEVTIRNRCKELINSLDIEIKL